MPRLFCSPSPTSTPSPRTHTPHVTRKTCALTNKIVSLYVSNCVPYQKQLLKLKTKPITWCETQPKNNLNSKKRFQLNLISKNAKTKKKPNEKNPNLVTKKQTTKRFWLWIKMRKRNVENLGKFKFLNKKPILKTLFIIFNLVEWLSLAIILPEWEWCGIVLTYEITLNYSVNFLFLIS